MGRFGMLAAGLAIGTVVATSGLGTQAARAASGDAAAAGNADQARRFVINLADKAIAVMADRALGDAQRKDRFRDLFVASFDLPTIGREVLGRFWRLASQAQQAQFLALFEREQVLVWAGRFKLYSGQTLTVDSAEPDAPGQDWRVEAHLNGAADQPIAVVWKIAQKDGIWRVSDLVIEGVSMALTMRQDFASVLSANGGKIDALLAAMQKKIDELAAG
jgi:phospholipid transport system substrate-binding protein